MDIIQEGLDTCHPELSSGQLWTLSAVVSRSFCDDVSDQYASTESMAYMVSGTMDHATTSTSSRLPCPRLFSGEAAWFVTDEAIQILRGMGYMRDSGLKEVMRDLRIFRIFEGPMTPVVLLTGCSMQEVTLEAASRCSQESSRT